MWGGPPVDDPRVLMHFESLDIARFPWFFKRYAQSLPTAPLPRDLPSTTARAVAVLAGTADVSPAELDLPQLSRLLHLSAGVVRKAAWAHGTWIYRAAGSAGGRFPLELYVVVPHGAGVPAGVHWYHPQEHALVHVGAPPRGEAPALVVTGIPWRTGWKYREREDRGAPVDVPLDESDPMEDVVLARSSQRRMDRARSLPESLVRTSMAVALRGVDVPHHVVVHNVNGIEPGLYGWPDLSNPVRSGAMRDTMYRLSFEQDLACDAAFVVIAATAVDALDDREYREAQLAAGLVEGRLHLASYSLGASASGMGFLDSEVPEFLDEPLDALLFTCVGVPEYKSARGGLPGAPSVIRTVRSRASSSTFTPPLPQRTN
jgi:hypothetical protein